MLSAEDFYGQSDFFPEGSKSYKMWDALFLCSLPNLRSSTRCQLPFPNVKEAFVPEFHWNRCHTLSSFQTGMCSVTSRWGKQSRQEVVQRLHEIKHEELTVTDISFNFILKVLRFWNIQGINEYEYEISLVADSSPDCRTKGFKLLYNRRAQFPMCLTSTLKCLCSFGLWSLFLGALLVSIGWTANVAS